MMILYPFTLVIVLPFLGAALIPAAALLGRKARLATALGAGLGTAVCSVLLPGAIQARPLFSAWWAPRYLHFGIGLDGLSVFMAMVAGVLGLIIMVYSCKYMADETDADLTRYYLLFLIFIGGMMGLVLSTNLLILYFFWEMVGLCSYALIGFDYRNPRATAAGIKAFLTTRIGDIGLFAGIMALYFGAQPHTFEIQALIRAAAMGGIPPVTLAFAGFAMIAGAVGKSAQVPLHVWLPDAMEAPTPISALIHAATMVNAGVYLMARVYPLFAGVSHWSQTLLWIGVITAFLAGLAALVERDLKRLLAYSTVSQLGFMMFAVGNGGLLAAQFHLVSHAIFKALLFLCAGSVIHAAGTRDMGKMGGFGRTMKATASGFAVGACALAGVPFFNGFFSKDMVFAAAFASGNYVPLALAILTAAMTVAYAGKAFVLVFLGPSRAAGIHTHKGEAPLGLVLPTSVLALGALTSWLAIGVFTGALARTDASAIPFGVRELLRETFTPNPALAGSFCALILGGLAFYQRETIAREARRHFAPVLRFIRAGFGFDAVYAKSAGLLVKASRGLFGGYDEQVADGLDVLLVRAFSRVSDALRKGHTGDLGLEALGLMLGLMAIFVVVFWK